MTPSPTAVDPLILGSSSPRRRQLLELLIPSTAIRIVAPTDPDEPPFAESWSHTDIICHLQQIARDKALDVRRQLPETGWWGLLTADTMVLADDGGQTRTLGKPDGPDWRTTVRDWFERYYLGKTHRVCTAVSLLTADGQSREFVAESSVRMRQADDEEVAWYIDTGEPLGKAGGYALQGAADIFIEQVTGGLSNVIGLPLQELRKQLNALRDGR